jgi:hypothetical protein
MRNTLSKLVLLMFTMGVLLVSFGCPDPPDEETPAPPPPPRIIGVSPADATGDHFYQLDVWARFDVAPASATLTLADAAGSAVTGVTALEESGRKVKFTPGADLAANETYTATITWDEEAPAPWSFSTGPYGEIVGDEAGLIGKVMHLDLASATFVEPPAIGSLLQGFLADVYIIFTLSPSSDLENSIAHVEGALGELNGPDIIQDLCSETLTFTAGPDRIPGTADDQDADWTNPELSLSGVDLELSIQGVNATIKDLLLSMVVHPAGTGFAGGRFEGILDTRDLAGLLGDEKDENGICDLVFKTVGVGCEECGGDDPGEFCLAVKAKDIVGAALPGAIVPLSCADVIEKDLNTEDCAGEAEAYWELDVDGNRVGEGYPLCAQWVPPSPG